MTTQAQITVDQVTEAIEAAVAEKGREFIYNVSNGCRYCVYDDGSLHTGTPTEASCLVGNVLHRLGVPLSELQGFEGNIPNLNPMQDWLLNFGLPPRTLRALRAAQEKQDRGRTWGEALDAYHGTL